MYAFKTGTLQCKAKMTCSVCLFTLRCEQLCLRTYLHLVNENAYVSSVDDVISQAPSYKSALSNDALLESAIPGYMEQQHQNMMPEHHPPHYGQDQLQDQPNFSNSLGVSGVVTCAS